MAMDKRNLALAAAHSASEATAELLRFAREGEHFAAPFDHDVEVFEKLCDAAKMAAEAERREPAGEMERDYFAARAEVLNAIDRFLEGWA